jgi:hypothetical protein
MTDSLSEKEVHDKVEGETIRLSNECVITLCRMYYINQPGSMS